LRLCKRCSTSHWFWSILSFGILLLAGSGARALPLNQDLKGEVVNEKDQRVNGAVCTLAGKGLPGPSLTATTKERGTFDFRGLFPGLYDLACTAFGYEPVLKKGLEITDTGAVFVHVVLPAAIVVRQKVEVRGGAPTISTQASAPSATISSPQLKTLPLVEQSFKAALPLVPGVVRTPDGKINIKGAVENQGMLLVDSAETVDPVTGSFSIEVPIDAVQSAEINKTAYSSEFGRFSGGLASVETKPPASNWDFELNDFFPTPRGKNGHMVGFSDFLPRLRLTGPLWKRKLNFSESFIYVLRRQPVRGLAWPFNETKRQGFNSFTNLQYVVSSRNLLTANLILFPLRAQFANINSLVPQSASSDHNQKGYSAGITDVHMFSGGGALTTLFQYTSIDSNAHGQGPADMLVTPNGWGGNFFNNWTRAASQQEVLQNYQLPPREGWGRHAVKIGGDFVHQAYDGTSVSHPVRLLRPDDTLAELISFLAPGSLAAANTEFALFAQDHWALNNQIAIDFGLRFSGQTIGTHEAVAPRLGIVYSPGRSNKTVLRGGVGIFYDRVLLLAGDFTQNPTRVTTFFDAQGQPLGSPVVFPNTCGGVGDEGLSTVPCGQRLASSPYNLTGNFEMDREIRPGLVVRLSYLTSRSYKLFIVSPQVVAKSGAASVLDSLGKSRYQEFEATMRYRPKEYADFHLSYVRSLARGDLNTLSSVFVPFEQPVIRPNVFADLPSNVSDRLVFWETVKAPLESSISTILDIHSGFPYSAVDVFQNYVGDPNSFRLPAFASLDLQASKALRLPWIPWLKNHKARGSFLVYNLTNHSNARDVYNNVASPLFGHFVGFQHRLYDLRLDIFY
jgi:hypothetical protein